MCRYFLIIISFFFNHTFSQELSLKEAIKQGLENNLQIKNVKLDLTSAKKKIWEITATGLPQVKLSANHQNFIEQPTSLIPAEFFGGTPGEFSEVRFGTIYNATGALNVSQLIFDGSYIVGLQSAKVYYQIAKNTKIKSQNVIRKNIINAYGNVLLVEESLVIQKNNLKTLEKDIFEYKQMYLSGFIEKEVLGQYQITLNTAKQQLTQLKRNKSLAYKLLNFSIGEELNAPVYVTDSIGSILKDVFKHTIDTIKFTVGNTIDYKISENTIKSKRLLLKLEQYKKFPVLKAELNSNYTGNSNSGIQLDASQKWFPTSFLNLKLELPVFTSFKQNSKIAQAKLDVLKAENELTLISNELSIRFEEIENTLLNAISKYQLTIQNLELAKIIVQKNNTKFKEGLITSSALRETQNQLYKTQQNYLNAILEIITRKAELELLLN